MVASSRAALRARGRAIAVDELQPLNVPRSVRVRCDADGRPKAVLVDGGWAVVAQVADAWRIATEWWRVPICRWYFEVRLADDRPLIIFEDREDPTAARWYRQRYPVGG